MIKYLICVLFLINFVKSNCDGPIFNNICCPDDCINCGVCTGNITLDELCCETTILKNNETCDEYDPPCILTGNSEDDFKVRIVEFFRELLKEVKDGNIISIVIFSAICLGGLFIVIFMTYTCCCFGKKKPLLDYRDIVGKYD